MFRRFSKYIVMATVAAALLATPEGQAHAPQADARSLAMAASDWML